MSDQFRIVATPTADQLRTARPVYALLAEVKLAWGL